MTAHKVLRFQTPNDTLLSFIDSKAAFTDFWNRTAIARSRTTVRRLVLSAPTH